MTPSAHIVQWILGLIIVLGAIGTISSKKPVHSCLCFLLTLFTLAAFYLQLSAPFIATMQLLVYAGAILVIFMFVIILFQDAYLQIHESPPKSSPPLLFSAAACLLAIFFLMGRLLLNFVAQDPNLPQDFGTVEHLGNALYLDFFFPFEAVILVFLIAIVGSLYIAKKVKS